MSSKNTNNITPSHWDILSEEIQAPCRIFDVYKRHCKHPENGKEGDFFVIKTNDFAITLGLTAKNEMILVKQYRFGSNSLSLEAPGGVVDKGEDIEKAAARELLEETGFSGKMVGVIGKCRPNPAILNNFAHYVLIEDCELTHDTNWDHHEELEVLVVPLEDVYKMVNQGDIDHGVILNGLFFLKNHLAKGTI